MKKESDDMNNDEPRFWTQAKRLERNDAFKKKEVAEVQPATMTIRWHELDDEMPLDDELPTAIRGETHTPYLWVKFRHPWLKNAVVVAKGRYDYDGVSWTARLSSVEDADVICNVVALAWAPIVQGERPWEGIMVRTHEADPW